MKIMKIIKRNKEDACKKEIWQETGLLKIWILFSRRSLKRTFKVGII